MNADEARAQQGTGNVGPAITIPVAVPGLTGPLAGNVFRQQVAYGADCHTTGCNNDIIGNLACRIRQATDWLGLTAPAPLPPTPPAFVPAPVTTTPISDNWMMIGPYGAGFVTLHFPWPATVPLQPGFAQQMLIATIIAIRDGTKAPFPIQWTPAATAGAVLPPANVQAVLMAQLT